MTTTSTTTTIQLQTIILKVGLHCDGCEKRVKKALWRVKGITSVDVDNKQERVIVTGFVDPAKVLKAVQKTGKSVEICKYQQSNSNNKSLFIVPTKFGNATDEARVTSTNSKKQNQFQVPAAGKYNVQDQFQAAAATGGGKYNVQDQFRAATGGGKYNVQDRSQHPQADYFLYDAEPEYAFSPKKHSNGNKMKVAQNKSGKEHKEQQHKPSSFKSHKVHSPQFESEDDQWNFESDEDNDFGYGSFHSNYENVKSSPHPNYGNSQHQPQQQQQHHQQQPQQQQHHQQQPQQQQKPSLKSSGYGNNQKSTLQSEFEYSKSPQSGYSGKSLYTNPAAGNVYSDSNKSPNKPLYTNPAGNGYSDGNKSPSKSQNKAHHYPAAESLYSSNSEHKSHNKSHYSGYSSNNDSKSHSKSPYSGYPSNSESKPQVSSEGYTSEAKSHQQQQKKQQKSGVEQKFVTFNDDQQQQHQQQHRPQQQVKQRGNTDDYGYEQRFCNHDQSFRPTYSFTYHEPSYRLPPANGGFATMFSEENPNACSIM